MSDVDSLKRHRVRRRHAVGTGGHGAASLSVTTAVQAATGTRAAGGVGRRTGARAAGGHSSGVANGVDTRTGAGASSGVGTGTAGARRSDGGGHVRRPNRHRATPWIVAHRAVAAVAAASVAALAVITAAVVGGGPPADTAAGGGEWTTVPASSPSPAVPSARQLSVPLPTTSPTAGAGKREPGSRAGGRGGRDRVHPGPKQPRPDPTPKQRPSAGRATPPGTVKADPVSAASPSLPGRPASTGSHQH